MDEHPKVITKVLSQNDTGETGGHQAGFLVPKDIRVLSFFPKLDCDELNPRTSMFFVDDAGKSWKFNFIYYNNKLFQGGGTRNEYRLTGMTRYFRENALKAGDSVILSHLDDGTDTIRYQRANMPQIVTTQSPDGKEKKKLILGNGWHVFDCE